MLSDDMACNPRNRFVATVYNHMNRFLDLYGSNVEVDYRGYDVTVENFIRLLTGTDSETVCWEKVGSKTRATRSASSLLQIESTRTYPVQSVC